MGLEEACKCAEGGDDVNFHWRRKKMHTNLELMHKREREKIGKMYFCQQTLLRKRCSNTIQKNQKKKLWYYPKLSSSLILSTLDHLQHAERKVDHQCTHIYLYTRRKQDQEGEGTKSYQNKKPFINDLWIFIKLKL